MFPHFGGELCCFEPLRVRNFRPKQPVCNTACCGTLFGCSDVIVLKTLVTWLTQSTQCTAALQNVSASEQSNYW